MELKKKLGLISYNFNWQFLIIYFLTDWLTCPLLRHKCKNQQMEYRTDIIEFYIVYVRIIVLPNHFVMANLVPKFFEISFISPHKVVATQCHACYTETIFFLTTLLYISKKA